MYLKDRILISANGYRIKNGTDATKWNLFFLYVINRPKVRKFSTVTDST